MVAIGASAGGFAAIATILRSLRPDFPLPIVVTMHLGPASIDTAERLARLIPFETDWARPGARLEAGRVLLCPPRSTLELLPDRTCATGALDGPALAEKPIDRFFESVARSFGERAVGLVLSGMADDGAAGARKLQLADGCVLVQSEASADQSSMPRAAIRSGAANVVLPLERIAAMLDDLAAGRPAPRRPSEADAVAAVFPGDGAASRSMRGVDWSRTPLGPVADWAPQLRIAARSVMSSKLPTALYWGRELVLLYNDAVLPYLGQGPDPAGKPARLVWPALWAPPRSSSSPCAAATERSAGSTSRFRSRWRASLRRASSRCPIRRCTTARGRSAACSPSRTRRPRECSGCGDWARSMSSPRWAPTSRRSASSRRAPTSSREPRSPFRSRCST